MSVDKEILSYFLEEATELLDDLTSIGGSLRRVGIPNDAESEKLADFAQKLNRLIGGTASVGFDVFAPLSRKTAMLAEKCADIKEMTIRLLIINLNNVIALLSEFFQNVDSMEKDAFNVGEIEKRVDICLSAVGLQPPEVKNQNEIDDLFESLTGGG
jgi:chemotaxis protein histidine kinase CheA